MSTCRVFATLSVALIAILSSHAFAASASRVGEPCGGTTNIQCAQDLWCKKPVGTCGRASVTGACIKLEFLCDAIFDPVCGCDGKDYGNVCESDGKTQVNFSGYCDQKRK
jgi:hypothetical protein